MMNIVDLLKQQLGGEVTKTLGGLAGASESDISKVLGSALPGLLSGLGSLASSKEGAAKISDAIGGMDSSLFGNLASMLGGPVASKGGGMLGNLFGAGLVDNLASSISKFSGINQGIVKMVLGYVTPMILGAIGKSLGGGRPDASSISRLFAEQKSNIASSLPSGFSLNSIPGFNALAGSGGSSSSSRPSAPPSPPAKSGGLGKLLVPAVLLAALVGLFVYWNNAKRAAEATGDAIAKGTADASKTVAEASKSVTDAGKSVADAVSGLGELSLDSIKGEFTGMFEGLTSKLGGVTDAAGAEAILPDLKDYVSKLDGFGKTVSALPAEGKSMIIELIKSQMDKINPILEKFTGIPEIGETVLQVIEQIREKLKTLMG